MKYNHDLKCEGFCTFQEVYIAPPEDGQDWPEHVRIYQFSFKTRIDIVLHGNNMKM